MTFRDPSALWLVALVPLAAAFLLRYAARRRREALALFLGEGSAQARGLARMRRLRGALTCGGLALIAFALAGPRAGTALRESRQESLDLLVLLDVSNSMRAEDVAPSRLDRARLEVLRLAEARRGDRLGLVVFAGDAFLQCPLTTDLAAFRLFLDAADTDLVTAQGTDIGRALALAERAFADAAVAEGGPPRPRAVLVVSDGEDHEGGAIRAADRLRSAGVALFGLGVGTEAGATIPERQGDFPGGLGGEVMMRGGEPVVTAYDGATLRDLAGRGRVYRLDGRAGVAGEIAEALGALDRAVLGTSRVAAAAERFQWPLGLGLLLLAAERALVLGLRRRERRAGALQPEASAVA